MRQCTAGSYSGHAKAAIVGAELQQVDSDLVCAWGCSNNVQALPFFLSQTHTLF